MLHAMIVDDEILAINLLESLLQDINYIKIIGKFSNPVDAFQQIPILQPNLLFLDIEMAEMNGIELANQLNERHTMDIVFVTAYEDYALKAFHVQATDYILKPIDQERLLKTVRRIYERRFSKRAIVQQNKELQTDPTIIHTLYFHVYSGKVSIYGKQLLLSTKEFQILFFLAQNEGKFFSANELYRLVWEEDSMGQTQSLRVHISNLRKKLDHMSGHGVQIIMERGQGYQLVFR